MCNSKRCGDCRGEGAPCVKPSEEQCDHCRSQSNEIGWGTLGIVAAAATILALLIVAISRLF